MAKIVTGRVQDHWAPYGNAGVKLIHGKHIIGTGVARAANDIDDVVELPQGIQIYDVELIVVDTAGATLTVDVGTRQVDGGNIEVGTWADDDDYFINAADANSATLYQSSRNTRHVPLEINQANVYLTTKFNNAVASANTVALNYIIKYETIGNR